MTRPTDKFPLWAETADPGDIVDPGSVQSVGWAAATEPPASFFNHWQRAVGRHLRWLANSGTSNFSKLLVTRPTINSNPARLQSIREFDLNLAGVGGLGERNMLMAWGVDNDTYWNASNPSSITPAGAITRNSRNGDRQLASLNTMFADHANWQATDMDMVHYPAFAVLRGIACAQNTANGQLGLQAFYCNTADGLILNVGFNSAIAYGHRVAAPQSHYASAGSFRVKRSMGSRYILVTMPGNSALSGTLYQYLIGDPWHPTGGISGAGIINSGSPAPSGHGILDGEYNDATGLVLLLGTNGIVYKSTNHGVSFSTGIDLSVSPTNTGAVGELFWDGVQFVVAWGTKIYASTDGTAWVNRTPNWAFTGLGGSAPSTEKKTITGIDGRGGQWLACNALGEALITFDAGQSWESWGHVGDVFGTPSTVRVRLVYNQYYVWRTSGAQDIFVSGTV